jgi:hypothetical protein
MGNGVQMSRVYASPVPAQVVKLQAIGNGADESLVGDAVGVPGLALPEDSPVSGLADVPNPDPARPRMSRRVRYNLSLLPESIWEPKIPEINHVHLSRP